MKTKSPGVGARRWLRKTSRAFAATLVIAVALTWGGSIYDHPFDRSIIAGMQSPACAAVHDMPAGALLIADQPDNAICRSFFLYRAVSVDAANDERTYANSILQSRIDEFRQLIPYVWLLSIACATLLYVVALVVRSLFRRGTDDSGRV